MKKNFTPIFIIFVLLAGLFIVSISTGIPRSFWKMQKRGEDVIQAPQSVKEVTSPAGRIN